MTDFSELVPISSIPSLNANLSSATEQTMTAILGGPHTPLTRTCQNDRASPTVTRLLELRRITENFRVTGIKPAVDSLEKVIRQVKLEEPELVRILSTEGMLCVRLRKPTSGQPSTKVSNHAWGTAIDFKLIGHEAPGDTGAEVPRWVAILVPHFNKAGWFSGIDFRDDMHFEIADETIRNWQEDGLLAPLVA